MGARQYAPLLGRFLEVDPIEGGSSNDYDYVNGDPNNSFDLGGEAPTKTKIAQQTYKFYQRMNKMMEARRSIAKAIKVIADCQRATYAMLYYASISADDSGDTKNSFGAMMFFAAQKASLEQKLQAAVTQAGASVYASILSFSNKTFVA